MKHLKHLTNTLLQNTKIAVALIDKKCKAGMKMFDLQIVLFVGIQPQHRCVH